MTDDRTDLYLTDSPCGFCGGTDTIEICDDADQCITICSTCGSDEP